jgi:hypothetical protein
MLSILRDEAAPADLRFEAAKAAAPYVHPKLAAIDHSVNDGTVVAPVLNVVIHGSEEERLLTLPEAGNSAPARRH